MSIELTPEQRQALSEGQPVEMVDPADNRRLVVLTADVFAQMQQATTPTPQQPPPPSQLANSLAAERRSVHIRVRDLPTPLQVQERIDAKCRRLCLGRGKYRRMVEDELKLSYYFGGHWIALLSTPNGPVVVAVTDDVASDTFTAQLECLSPKEQRERMLFLPSPWNSEVAWLSSSFIELTFPDEDPCSTH